MKIDVHTSPAHSADENTGIGDVLVAIPAVLGLKEQYPESDIRLQLKSWQVPWARLFWQNSWTYNDSSLESDKAEQHFYTLSTGFWSTNDILAKSKGLSRLTLICDKFGVKPKFPESIEIDEASAACSPLFITGDHKAPLVVIAPHSLGCLRVWPIQYFCWLGEAFVKKGYRVAFLGKTGLSSSGEALIVNSGISLLGDISPCQAALLLSQSNLFVGNDSGMSHLCGLLKRKAIAICGMSDGQIVYGSYPTVSVIQSDYYCSGCNLRPDNGFRPICRLGCRALYEVQPETVLEKSLQLLTI